MNKEIWEDIEGYEGLYQVSNLGRVKSLNSNVGSKVYIKKHKTDPYGYKFVTFYHKGKPKSKSIHRLLAEHFIPNPKNKPTVNHIDYNRANNVISNLEWSTYSEQQYHRYKRKQND